MRTVRTEALSAAAFLPFGNYANCFDPQGEYIGGEPIWFFRDLVQQSLGSATNASFSTCRVVPRPLVVTTLECHSFTGEVLLPLDEDVVIYVAPATPPAAPVPLDRLRAFDVPRGTLVALRPGVWHHAPLVRGTHPANVLVVLPERAYANDCSVVELAPDERVQITLSWQKS
jgi:ureidoglycolate lyase